jgi:hypothetical protein
MKSLHYNCFAGICGDMNLGAMVDLGVPVDELTAELVKLNVDGWKLESQKDIRKGISGTKVTVVLDNHSHNEKSVEHHHHHHDSRDFSQIKDLINSSELSIRVKNNAIAIFQVLADAEGKVHNKPADEVHFHEVGAVDSIIDIVGAAICYNILKIDIVTSSTIELGGGTVKCAHGIMPVPAPATAEILLDIPVSQGADNKECTTPTGAAILKTVVSEYNPKNSVKTIRTGYGIGQRDSNNISNSLQVMLLDTNEKPEDNSNDIITENLFEITATMDDISPEKISYLSEKLFACEALDVWQYPVFMKKNRTGVEVTALCSSDKKESIINCFFINSTTLGVRENSIKRHSLKREIQEVDTKYGKIRVKKAFLGAKEVSSKAEFEDVKRAAEKHSVSLEEVYNTIPLEL